MGYIMEDSEIRHAACVAANAAKKDIKDNISFYGELQIPEDQPKKSQNKFMRYFRIEMARQILPDDCVIVLKP